ncbi:hypothetical protein [Haloarchaeobius sp. DT45]|uniref:hypothetical protein n=1 Tax=Haloarchaeobius sp. DT45 TaxID=3446116 RepID=UPI003F6AEA22
MQIQKSTVLQSTVVVLVIPLFWAVGYIISNQWSILSPSQKVDAAISAAGAVGTLMLALLTLVTLNQNEKLVEEKQRENEKPLVRNLLYNLLLPSITALENNIENIEQESEIDWVYMNLDMAQGFGQYTMLTFESLTPLLQINQPGVNSRFKASRQDLWNRMREYDDQIIEMVELSNEIESGLEHPVREYLTENGLDDSFERESDFRSLLSAIIKQAPEYGESHKHYEIWEQHRTNLIQIMDQEVSEKYSELKQEEKRLLDESTELKDDLEEYQVSLQEEYGITIDEEPKYLSVV